ncbi:hypothetical protein P3T18_002820 [Paraburkholderia sp. GAS199]|uniref:hypothetical protein n=1 Tax=Paraburkholderia sp. GAS199 TaxID=3035126 RepID=UPI003D1FF2DF
MIEFISPAVLSAVLRASSSPIFSAWLARASMFAPRETRHAASTAAHSNAVTTEGTLRV